MITSPTVAWMNRWPRSYPRHTGSWTVTRPGAWATLEPETGEVTPVHPASDRRLPGLAPALAGGGRLVSYRVGRRAVVADGHRWVKVIRPSRLAGLVAIHRLIGDGLGPAGIDSPHVLAQHDDGRLELSTVPGRSLHHMLREVTDVGAGVGHPDDRADTVIGRAIVDIARAMAVLHDLPIPDDLAVRPPDEPARFVEQVGRAEPRIVASIGAVAASLPTPVGRGGASLIHADLHDKNLFVGSDGGIGLIDLDGVARGDAESDLANLAVHLELRALQSGIDHGVGRAWADQLVDAYRRHRAVDLDELASWRRLVWFRLACLYRLRIPGRELADRLLGLAVDDR